MDTQDFVDAHASIFEDLGGPLAIDFIRTSSDQRHRPAVERLWRACASNGDLYRRAYEGDYCVGCEQFYSADALIKGCCPDHRTPLERVSEENWFFRLSAYQDYLESLISSGQLAVRPEPFREEVLTFIRGGLEDISVSRSVTRARGWGIEVPGDPTQVVYVWFDALSNYISALGYGDPTSSDYRTWWLESNQRVHVIGKGILRFHAVYWPAFLASAGEPPPTRIQVHPYLTVGGEKLSKSSGNSIDPIGITGRFGTDALRWWFARDVAPIADTDFTTERLISRINEDLANGIGNFSNRIATLVHRLCSGIVPPIDIDPIDEVHALEGTVNAHLADFDLRKAAQAIVDAVGALNRDLEAKKPWQLGRHEGLDANERIRLEALLAQCVLSARIIARAVEPIAPRLAERLLGQLGGADQPPKPEPIFPRVRAD